MLLRTFPRTLAYLHSAANTVTMPPGIPVLALGCSSAEVSAAAAARLLAAGAQAAAINRATSRPLGLHADVMRRPGRGSSIPARIGPGGGVPQIAFPSR